MKTVIPLVLISTLGGVPTVSAILTNGAEERGHTSSSRVGEREGGGQARVNWEKVGTEIAGLEGRTDLSQSMQDRLKIYQEYINLHGALEALRAMGGPDDMGHPNAPDREGWLQQIRDAEVSIAEQERLFSELLAQSSQETRSSTGGNREEHDPGEAGTSGTAPAYLEEEHQPEGSVAQVLVPVEPIEYREDIAHNIMRRIAGDEPFKVEGYGEYVGPGMDQSPFYLGRFPAYPQITSYHPGSTHSDTVSLEIPLEDERRAALGEEVIKIPGMRVPDLSNIREIYAFNPSLGLLAPNKDSPILIRPQHGFFDLEKDTYRKSPNGPALVRGTREWWFNAQILGSREGLGFASHGGPFVATIHPDFGGEEAAVPYVALSPSGPGAGLLARNGDPEWVFNEEGVKNIRDSFDLVVQEHKPDGRAGKTFVIREFYVPDVELGAATREAKYPMVNDGSGYRRQRDFDFSDFLRTIWPSLTPEGQHRLAALSEGEVSKLQAAPPIEPPARGVQVASELNSRQKHVRVSDPDWKAKGPRAGRTVLSTGGKEWLVVEAQGGGEDWFLKLAGPALTDQIRGELLRTELPEEYVSSETVAWSEGWENGVAPNGEMFFLPNTVGNQRAFQAGRLLRIGGQENRIKAASLEGPWIHVAVQQPIADHQKGPIRLVFED